MDMQEHSLGDLPVGRYFEDFEAGQRFRTGGMTLTEEAIIRFSLEWDPQPFHLDAIAAKKSVFGGLVASGMHTIAVTNRLLVESGLLKGTALAGLGFTEVRFPRPVRVGDTLSLNIEVLAASPSSKPGRGKIQFGFRTCNQDGEEVLTQVLNVLVATRPMAGDQSQDGLG